ncbi:MAG: kynureninase [Bacteroidetes bacterium]|nr:kynureninase [Bacteroidota bacterium]
MNQPTDITADRATHRTAPAFQADRASAAALDQSDPLAAFRDSYHFPRHTNGEPMIYLVGNSLGLQPKGVGEAIEQELRDWAELGVEGHFEAKHPWYSYHEIFAEPAAALVGAKPGEVVVMNTLTTNLHLMMVSFYRPTSERYKIVVEWGAFPSDKYAVWSQARFHGFDPEQAVVELHPRDGQDLLLTEDIERYLAEHGHEVALVMMGGVNFYTGQAFDMERITAAAHAAGCVVGFDLAHAAGNLDLRLHDWDVDFAVWCGYKYLNSGPGGVSGCFVHERHAFSPDLPRFAGWWGNDPGSRFEMRPDFLPQRGAGGWQLSNAQILPMAAHRVALDLFTQAGMQNLRAKSVTLTAYLEYLIDLIPGDRYTIITPRDPAQRGCQLSIRTTANARDLAHRLRAAGVTVDFRPPDVIRVAPVPMYNTFLDAWRFADILATLF